jgi:hypothetical protein
MYKRRKVFEAIKKTDKGVKTLYGSSQKREKAYRGWSERVFTDMLKLKTEVEEDCLRYKQFSTAFQCVIKRINTKKEELEEEESDGELAVVSRAGGGTEWTI